MTIDEFRTTTGDSTPPTGLSTALRAMWFDAKGDWQRAHSLAQEQDDQIGAWVHAYLHRVEGDPANAAYWYRRAGRSVSQTSLAEEWTEIVGELLA